MSPPNRERAFDLARLQADVREKMAAEGLSLRAVSRGAGIAPSSVTWILTGGRRPDADSLVRILAWLFGDDSPLQRYTLGRGTDHHQDAAEIVTRQPPNLPAVRTNALMPCSVVGPHHQDSSRGQSLSSPSRVTPRR